MLQNSTTLFATIVTRYVSEEKNEVAVSHLLVVIHSQNTLNLCTQSADLYAYMIYSAYTKCVYKHRGHNKKPNEISG